MCDLIMSEEQAHLIEVAGYQYDLAQSTTPIAVEDEPIPTDIIREDPGPGGTIILQTRHHIYVRAVDGSVSKLQLGEGVDLEALRNRLGPVIPNIENINPPPPKKPVKDSVARVARRLEIFSGKCEQQFEKCDKQLERNTQELANMRELLQACLDGIAAKNPDKEVETGSRTDSASEQGRESDYVSVSENEKERRRKKKKKKTPNLNFTNASASTKIHENSTVKPRGQRRSANRDEGNESTSTGEEESDGGTGSHISSILMDKSKRPKSKTASFSIPLINPTSSREPTPPEKRTTKTNPRDVLSRSTSRNSSRSNNTIPVATFASKSLQKLHQESIDIEPYLGPNRDSRAPLFFLEQFRRQVVDNVDSDHACGEMFYGNLKKSKWCRQWLDKVQVHMGFERMEKIFLQMEWTNQTQILFFKQFEAANQNNSQFINFLDFYNYWRERIRGVEVSDRYVIEHFRNNMPTRVQMLVDVTKIKKLKHFDELIKQIPESDLAWHELSNPQTIEKREELLAKDDTKINSGDAKKPFQKYTSNNDYKKLAKANYTYTNCSCHPPQEDGGNNQQSPEN